MITLWNVTSHTKTKSLSFTHVYTGIDWSWNLQDGPKLDDRVLDPGKSKRLEYVQTVL